MIQKKQISIMSSDWLPDQFSLASVLMVDQIIRSYNLSSSEINNILSLMKKFYNLPDKVFNQVIKYLYLQFPDNIHIDESIKNDVDISLNAFLSDIDKFITINSHTNSISIEVPFAKLNISKIPIEEFNITDDTIVPATIELYLLSDRDKDFIIAHGYADILSPNQSTVQYFSSKKEITDADQILLHNFFVQRIKEPITALIEKGIDFNDDTWIIVAKNLFAMRVLTEISSLSKELNHNKEIYIEHRTEQER